MEHPLTICHGSQKIIRTPIFGEGNPRNDYGLGFYCTEKLSLAKEWTCNEENSGYANVYRLDLSGLTVLNLSGEHYHILNWLSILLQNRVFKIANDIAAEGRDYLLERFLPDYQLYDIIIGYRADDSYFSFANAFLNNTLSLTQLEKAMYLGKLGEQIVLKSQKAFRHISFQEAVAAEKEIYFPKKSARDMEARDTYRRERKNRRASSDIYLIDILREEWKENDPRLRRNLPQRCHE